jgi:hypothetical protein
MRPPHNGFRLFCLVLHPAEVRISGRDHRRHRAAAKALRLSAGSASTVRLSSTSPSEAFGGLEQRGIRRHRDRLLDRSDFHDQVDGDELLRPDPEPCRSNVLNPVTWMPSPLPRPITGTPS